MTKTDQEPLTNVELNAINERVVRYGKWRAEGGGWAGRIIVETVDSLYRDALALYAEVYRLRVATPSHSVEAVPDRGAILRILNDSGSYESMEAVADALAALGVEAVPGLRPPAPQ